MSTPTHYEWLPEGASVPVRLSFDALDIISQAVSQGFAAVPKRGAEVGGILLGRVAADGAAVIEAAESVTCSYAYGPAYELTNDDLDRFQAIMTAAAAAGDHKPIGMFRSVTGTAFAPTASDTTLFDLLFPEQNSLMLVVKPDSTRVSRAGFFLRQGKKLPAATPLEFPFSRKLLGGGSRRRRDDAPPPVMAEIPPVVTVAPVELPEPAPPAASVVAPSVTPAAPQRRISLNLGFILASVTLAAALGLAGGYFLGRKVPLTADPARYSVRLAIEDRVTELVIQWDTKAEALRTAAGGRLRIKGGTGTVSVVPLEFDQLRAGRAVFAGNGSQGIEAELELRQLSGSTLIERATFSPPAEKR